MSNQNGNREAAADDDFAPRPNPGAPVEPSPAYGSRSGAMADGYARKSAAIERNAPRGLVERGLTAAVGAGVSLAKLPFRIARPIVMSRVFAPARNAANEAVSLMVDATASIVAERLTHNSEAADLIAVYTERLLLALAQDPLTTALVHVQAEQYVQHLAQHPEVAAPMVDVVANRTLQSLARNPAALHALVRVLANDYVAYMTRNPDLLHDAADGYVKLLEQNPQKLDTLVQSAANRYLGTVERNPEPIGVVVQVVGDRYMNHLNDNPDAVQDLLAGQSAGIAVEVVDEVRERTVNLDERVESMVRRVLRMKPRTSNQVGQPAPGLAGNGDGDV